MGYFYYWYHHMALSNETIKRINAIISKRDWESFLMVKNDIESQSKLTYLPMEMIDDRGNWIELNKDNFKLITTVECECG